MHFRELFREVNGDTVEVRVPSFEEFLQLEEVPASIRARREAILAAKTRRFGNAPELPAGVYRFPLTRAPKHTIKWIPSPNFSNRPSPRIDMLVFHYTVSSTLDATVTWFRNPDARASAHYVIGKDGQIVQMVAEEKKAWHAGKSYWQGESGCNAFSIGIEIVNEGENKGIPYTPEQYEAAIFLGKRIVEKYGIPAHRVVGHSDIAPYRKIDPGKHFNWKLLAENGIGVFYQPPGRYPHREYGGFTLQRGDNDRRGIYGGQTSRPGGFVRQLQSRLRKIGYFITLDGDFGPKTEAVVEAFQRHYLPGKISGKVDADTAWLIRQLTPDN